MHAAKDSRMAKPDSNFAALLLQRSRAAAATRGDAQRLGDLSRLVIPSLCFDVSSSTDTVAKGGFQKRITSQTETTGRCRRDRALSSSMSMRG